MMAKHSPGDRAKDTFLTIGTWLPGAPAETPSTDNCPLGAGSGMRCSWAGNSSKKSSSRANESRALTSIFQPKTICMMGPAAMPPRMEAMIIIEPDI